MIVLLDVDETLAISNTLYGVHDGGYRYNDALISVLKSMALSQCYLFTSYSLGSIAKSVQEEEIGAPSRAKLIAYLKSNNIEVCGVITPYDRPYNGGPGGYYQKVIGPFEEQVMRGAELKEGNASYPAYLALVQKERQELSAQRTDKGQMYEDLMEAYTDDARANWFTGGVFFLDDRQNYLNQVEETHKNRQYAHNLISILVKPGLRVEDYREKLGVKERSGPFLQLWHAVTDVGRHVGDHVVGWASNRGQRSRTTLSTAAATAVDPAAGDSNGVQNPMLPVSVERDALEEGATAPSMPSGNAVTEFEDKTSVIPKTKSVTGP